MALFAYQLFTWIASPLLYLYLLRRKFRGKEDPARFGERFGYAGMPRPQGTLVWFHASSVGESLSILPVIARLRELHPTVHVLLTTGTVNSAKLAATRLAKGAMHQYVPIDTLPAVRRFLQHWQPNLALWVESELWPNLVLQTSRYCPMLILNGRMSDHSFQAWQRYPKFSRHLLNHYALVLAQSTMDAERFSAMGAPNVTCAGNIKFDAPPLPADPQKVETLTATIGNRPVWMMASTHANEEELGGHVHLQLKAKHPRLLTIIAPRHPHRADDIAQALTQMGLKVSQRSQGHDLTDEADIYLADTMGELGIFYRLSPIVYIGGSLVPHGGQNPLEPSRLNCAILFGPHMFNFKEIRQEMLDAHAAIEVADMPNLAQTLSSLLSNPGQQRVLAGNAADYVTTKNGVLNRFVDTITPYLTTAK